MTSISDRVNFLQRSFGNCMLGSDGLNLNIQCLNSKCSSITKNKLKLVIKLDDEKYHCWVCGIKGVGVSGLLKRYAPRYFDESTKYFNRKKIHIHDNTIEEYVVQLPKDFKLLASSKSVKDPDVQAVVNYLYSRGLSRSDFWRFKFGTCTNGTHRRRVIFPSHLNDGTLNYWVSRVIDDDRQYKYKNPKSKKNEIIFNDINIDWTKPLVLVEGPFDLVKCTVNSTCLLGSELDEKFALFHKIVINKTPVILALDSDATYKSHKIAKKLFQFGIDVSVLPLGKFKDVGEMSKTDFEKQLSHIKRWSHAMFLDDKINRISSGSLF